MRPHLISAALYCSIIASLVGIHAVNAQVPPDEPKQALPAPPAPPPAPPTTPTTPTTPTVSYVVPDASLRAVVDRVIAVRLLHGPAINGRLLAFDGDTVTLAAANGEIFSIQRSEVSGIRLLGAFVPETPSPNDVPPSDSTPPAPQTRSIGLHLSIPPGIAVDIDYGLFHGFANASLVFPIATDGKWAGFSVGAGVGIPILSRAPSLKLDVFAHINVMAMDNYYYSSTTSDVTFGFGIGIGLHYTVPNGFTVGFACPILGYSANSNSQSSSDGASGYYLSSAVAMPLGFLGYRF
jgi:hypothetical protein